MGNQSPSLVRSRREPARTKHHIMPDGVRLGVHIPRRALGSRAGMHPHVGKVIAETLLHVLPERWLQRSSWTGKGLVHAGGGGIHWPGRWPGKTLDARR